MRDHTKLKAFRLSDELAIMVYAITSEFPKSEMFGLTSQMRRAAVSVPSNIVEGCARESQAEYLRFLEIAFGSLRELGYQYSLAKRLHYFNSSDTLTFELKIDEAQKVLGGLIRAIRRPKRQ